MKDRKSDKFELEVLARCGAIAKEYSKARMTEGVKKEMLPGLASIAADLGVKGSAHSPTPEAMLLYYYFRFSLLRDGRGDAKEAFDHTFRWVFEDLDHPLMLVHWTLRLEGVWDAVRKADEPVRETAMDIVLRARSKAPLLLVGETGAGKEHMARAIHKLGDRRNRKMLAINCAAIPEGTAESELFGHEKGSYTGASKEFKGIIERANKSTLFLDEVAKMPLPLQAKLLRALDDGVVRKMGGNKDIKVDVRFIAAVHPSNLEDGSLLPDLKYRLGHPDVLEIKPLRERLAGDEALAEDILREALTGVLVEDLGIGREEAIGYGMSGGCSGRLKAHPFPGNYRELKSALRAAARQAVARGSKKLLHDDLALDEKAAPGAPPAQGVRPQSIAEAIEAGKGLRAELVAEAVERLVARHGSFRNALRAEGVDGNAYHVARREVVAATGMNIGELLGRAKA